MATTFKFKLEPVLKHRQMIEDEKQRDLAKALREKHIIETQLRHYQETISSEKRNISGGLVGAIDVRVIRQHGNHVGQVTFRAQQLAVKLMSVHRQIEQARVELLKATTARKAVELLRDRQHERWMAEQRRRETLLHDELSTQGHMRRMREGEGR
jgi:flagellar FliJ protein